jgi:putative endonuclease
VNYYVYLLASKKNGTLYVGFTSDLIKRVWSHKNKCADGFTLKYGVDKLMWYESTPDRNAALYREKQIKKWNRQWKIELIQKENPNWKDLYEDITASGI